MCSQTNSRNRAVFLAAGGTGGHVFPALHTAGALKARGFDVSIITDKRGLSLLPENMRRKTIYAASPFAGSLTGRILALAKLSMGFLQVFILLLRQRPVAVIGYGGYPAASPTLAAWLLRIPVWLHEQNAVMGRTNQLMSKFDKLVKSFPHNSVLVDKPDNAILNDFLWSKLVHGSSGMWK